MDVNPHVVTPEGGGDRSAPQQLARKYGAVEYQPLQVRTPLSWLPPIVPTVLLPLPPSP